MINTYYLLQGGEQTGPYTQYQLMDMDVAADTMVLSPLSADWQEASDLPEFSIYFETKGIFVPGHANYASFWWRLLAYLLDYVIFLVLIVLVFTLILIVLLLAGNSHVEEYIDTHEQLFNLIGFIMIIVYHSVCEATPLRGGFGKRICKLAVVDAGGKRITIGKAFSRNIAKLLSGMVLCLGFLNVLWDDKRQGWHDGLAKTYVIRRR